MFDEPFNATFEKIELRRPKRGEGEGEIRAIVTLGCILTEQLADDLGEDVGPVLEWKTDFKVTVKEVTKGLIFEAWHLDNTDGDPYIAIGDIETKKVELKKDKETGTIILSILIRSPSLTEAVWVKFLHCYRKTMVVKLEFAQQKLEGVE